MLSIKRRTVISTIFQIVFITLYFWYKNQTIAGAIFGLVLEIIFLFTVSAASFLVKKLDHLNILGKLKLVIKNATITFFRRNDDIRKQTAWISSITLIAIVVGEFFWNMFFENIISLTIRISVLLLLVIIFFLLSIEIDDMLSHSVNIRNVQGLLRTYNLIDAQNHFNKSLAFIKDLSNPDPENCVKEAVCALEAGLESLTKEPASQDFTTVVRKLQKNDGKSIPPPIAEGMIKLHAYRGSGKGIAHAALEGNTVSIKEAELALSLVATYLVYLCETYGIQQQK